jgi:hypothetical protein
MGCAIPPPITLILLTPTSLSICLIAFVVLVYSKFLFSPFLTSGILALMTRAVSLAGYIGQGYKLLATVLASSFHFDLPDLYSLGKTKCNVHPFLKIRQEDTAKTVGQS